VREEAMLMSARAALTYEDYAALPDDGRRYELLDGELSVTPAPGSAHQIILANLFRIVDAHVRARDLGLVLFAPLDVILAETTVVEPDLVYLDQAGRRRVSRRGVEGAPVLLVEVLSPGTVKTDRSRKFALYARYGVPYYWIVDQEARAVEAYRLDGPTYVVAFRAQGRVACDPPPFSGLGLVADDLWP
jgi:Uma2 family endonuclease